MLLLLCDFNIIILKQYLQKSSKYIKNIIYKTMSKLKKYNTKQFNSLVFKPNTKPKSFYVKVFILVSLVIILLNSVALNIIAETNFHHNKKMEQTFSNFNSSGFITHQNNAKDFKFGLANSDFNGCGWVAVYNACKVLGIDITISEIIKELDLFALNAYGLLGGNPFYVKRFFEKKGYEAKIHLNKNNFNTAASSSQVSVIGYVWHNILDGGHYQTLVKHSSQANAFQFYNSSYTKTMEQYITEKSDAHLFLITINS